MTRRYSTIGRSAVKLRPLLLRFVVVAFLHPVRSTSLTGDVDVRRDESRGVFEIVSLERREEDSQEEEDEFPRFGRIRICCE